jgi:hypothetical protein
MKIQATATLYNAAHMRINSVSIIAANTESAIDYVMRDMNERLLDENETIEIVLKCVS